MAVAALLLLTAGAAGCTSSASRGIHDAIQTARCFSAVAKAASPGNKQAATVRYALILEACKTKAMLNSAVLRRLGKKGLSFTVAQIAAGMRRHQAGPQGLRPARPPWLSPAATPAGPLVH